LGHWEISVAESVIATTPAPGRDVSTLTPETNGHCASAVAPGRSAAPVKSPADET
jgi:hypothetical protein